LANWPLPKSQLQKRGLPEDLSVKLTARAAHPEVLLAVKSATGVWAQMDKAANQKNKKTNKFLKINYLVIKYHPQIMPLFYILKLGIRTLISSFSCIEKH
jgi:hypothetical protein